MRPRTVEDEQLLDLLLDAFADLGFEGASMRSLCRHLGMSHNLMHERLGTKENAWYRAVDHGFIALGQAMLDMPVDSVPTDPVGLLRTVMQRFAVATIERPALARIIQQEAARPGPRFDYIYERHLGTTRAQTKTLLEYLQNEGIFKPGLPLDPVHFFLTTWGIGGLSSVPETTAGVGGSLQTRLDVAWAAVDVVIDGMRVRPD